jgi:hypothetical protein
MVSTLVWLGIFIGFTILGWSIPVVYYSKLWGICFVAVFISLKFFAKPPFSWVESTIWAFGGPFTICVPGSVFLIISAIERRRAKQQTKKEATDETI